MSEKKDAVAKPKKKLDGKEKLQLKTMVSALRNALKAGLPCGVVVGGGLVKG